MRSSIALERASGKRAHVTVAWLVSKRRQQPRTSSQKHDAERLLKSVAVR